MTRSEFITFIMPYISDAVNETSTVLQPSVILARAIIESANSKGLYLVSELQTKYNNFFGITASKAYTGNKALVKTWEAVPIKIYGDEQDLGKDSNGRYVYMRYFRSYATPKDSIKDFINLMQNNPIYSKVLTATTPEQQATEIINAGYATAKNAKDVFLSVLKRAKASFLDFVPSKKEITNAVKNNSNLVILFIFGLLFLLFINK